MFDIMSIYNGSVVAIAILVFLLGSVAVKSARSATARAFIILSAVLVYTAVFVGPLQLLSYAKTTDLEWINRNVEEAEVLHAELREGIGIFLLLDWYGEPRYYRIPWDKKRAQELIEAMEEAREKAGGEQRPGTMEPTTGGEAQDQERELVDQLLGPMGKAEGKGETENKSEGDGELGDENQRGDMSNAGNGRVMMRNPFKADASTEGVEQRGESEDGEGPGARFEDEASPAMFYAVPQERYPEKSIPGG